MLLSIRNTLKTKVQTRFVASRYNSSLCEKSADEKKREERLKQQNTFTINIPEKELAHNTFFSLHRPLLGLSNKRPFFSAYSIEEEEKAEEEMHISQYMSRLEHFVEPGKEEEKHYDIIKIEKQEIMHSPLPVFRMPESADIIDFLSDIENKLKKK